MTKIIKNMSALDYDHQGGLRSSKMKRALRGRRAFYTQSFVGNDMARLGTIAHAMCFNKLHEEVEEMPDNVIADSVKGYKEGLDKIGVRYNKSSLKPALKRLCRENGLIPATDWRPEEGKVAAFDGDLERVQSWVDAVMQNPLCRKLIETSDHEVSGFWEDPRVGTCKARADILHPKLGVWDIKFTSKQGWMDLSEMLARFIFERGYHQQNEWYQRVFGKSESPGLIICYVGNKDEDPVAEAITFDEDWYELGRLQNEKCLHRIERWYNQDGGWDGPSEDDKGRARIVKSAPAAWMMKKEV